jgi:putative membrane protein
MRQLITAILIALATVIFALQNAGPVDVKFFFWELSNASLALVIIITLIIGLVSGLMMQFQGIRRRNKQIAEQQKKISELEKRGVSAAVNK